MVSDAWQPTLSSDCPAPFNWTVAKKTGESVYIYLPSENNEGVFIDSIDSPQILKISGTDRDWMSYILGHPTGLSLPICPKIFQETRLKKVNWSTIPFIKAIELRLYKKNELCPNWNQGYALTLVRQPGTTGIAAPIFSYENIVATA